MKSDILIVPVFAVFGTCRSMHSWCCGLITIPLYRSTLIYIASYTISMSHCMYVHTNFAFQRLTKQHCACVYIHAVSMYVHINCSWMKMVWLMRLGNGRRLKHKLLLQRHLSVEKAPLWSMTVIYWKCSH